MLAPGGRGLLIDLSRDALSAEASREFDRMGLSTMNRLLTKIAFRTMRTRSAYTRAEFEQILAQTKFSSVGINQDRIGFEIRMTK